MLSPSLYLISFCRNFLNLPCVSCEIDKNERGWPVTDFTLIAPHGNGTIHDGGYYIDFILILTI
jgi:hypothetical protein